MSQMLNQFVNDIVSVSKYLIDLQSYLLLLHHLFTEFL